MWKLGTQAYHQQQFGLGLCQWCTSQSSPMKYYLDECDPINTQKIKSEGNFIYILSFEGEVISYILVGFTWSLKESKAKKTM